MMKKPELVTSCTDIPSLSYYGIDAIGIRLPKPDTTANILSPGSYYVTQMSFYSCEHIEVETNCRHFADNILKCIFVNELNSELNKHCSPKQVGKSTTRFNLCYWRVRLLTGITRHNGDTYRKISNISRTKSPNLNVSRLVLQLSLPSVARC